MEELIKRLRAMARHEHDDATIGDEAADALEAQQAEISSFCMNYRMKCDEEIKSLHIQIEAQQARIAERLSNRRFAGPYGEASALTDVLAGW